MRATAHAVAPRTSAADDRRAGARRARGRAHRAQFRRPPVGHRDARPPTTSRAPQARQGAHLLHAQDHAGPARAGEIRGALRRRLQPPLRARRRDPDQGQPHRGRRRHPRRCWSARAPSPAISSRSRSRSIRSTQLREVLDTGLADVVLLDNMDLATLREAVDDRSPAGSCWRPPAASRWTRIAAIAATGVDYISSGALTHSAPNFDCALDIEM